MSALNNSLTIYDAATTIHTYRPISLSRYFVKGEIPNYASPRIGGVGASVWQCDVKTRWNDGSVQHAIISLRASISSGSSITVDFVNSANRSSAGTDAQTNSASLDQAGILAASWGSKIEGTVNSITYSASSRAIVTAGNWFYWLRGPVVTSIVVDTAPNNRNYDFGWQWITSAWQAPTSDIYKSIHPWFEVSIWPDPDGGGPITAWGGIEVGANILLSWTDRLQKQVFDLNIYKTSAENSLQYTKSAATFDIGRSFSELYWDGTAPSNIQIGFNFPYMVTSKVIPPIRRDIYGNLDSSTITTNLSNYDTKIAPDVRFCAASTEYCGSVYKNENTAGGRGDISLIPSWYEKYLLMMDGSLTVATRYDMFSKLVLGNANGAASQPVHYLEGETGRVGQRNYYNYPFNPTQTAFGMPLSISARPEFWSFNDTAIVAQDRIIDVCTTSPCSRSPNSLSWATDASHTGGNFLIPYLLTGRFYWLRELTLNAHRRNSEFYYTIRVKDWGFPLAIAQIRSSAWATRELFSAWLMSVDGTPEKQYLWWKLKNAIVIFEGMYRAAIANYAPADPVTTCAAYSPLAYPTLGDLTAGYCVGYLQDRVNGSINPGGYMWMLPHVLSHQFGTTTPDYDGFISYAFGGQFTRPWQEAYVMSVWAWISHTGTLWDGAIEMARPMVSKMFQEYINFSLNSDTRPFHWFERYGTPQLDNANNFITSTAQYDSFVVKTAQLVSSIGAADTSFVINMKNNGPNAILIRNNTENYWRIDNEIIKSCSFLIGTPITGQTTINVSNTTYCWATRGAFGTVPAIHTAGAPISWFKETYDRGTLSPSLTTTHWYPWIFYSAFSLGANLDKIDHRPWRAMEFQEGNIINDYYPCTYDPTWCIEPAEQLSNIYVISFTTSAKLYFTHKSAQGIGPCKIALNPTSSDDSSDATPSGGSRNLTYTFSPLTSQTTYNYRISCGKVRTHGSFTTN